MHVLIVNDDGPLNDATCPYIKYLVDEILESTDWQILIVVPDQQRSWIGKAHFAGKTLSSSYIYTRHSTSEPNDRVNAYEGPYLQPNEACLKSGAQEWILIDLTPAACTDIGLHHLSGKPPVDLVISGPNFGKNAGNIYILASGTVGAAMEAATHGYKSIALSYEFRSLTHDFHTLKEAGRISVALVQYLYKQLCQNPNIDLFSVNVPLIQSLKFGTTKIHYTPVLKNQWGSIYEARGAGKYAWLPNFKQVYEQGKLDTSHSDSRVLHDDGISVTPLQAAFRHVPPLGGEIVLGTGSSATVPETESLNHAVPEMPLLESYRAQTTPYFLISVPESSYIYAPLVKAFEAANFVIETSTDILSRINSVRVFHYAEYEDLDFELICSHPKQYYALSYVYRKALIRKHYLANTIHQYVVKNPGSILCRAFPETYHLEVDFAEFLDDALDESYELRDEIEKGLRSWILKPSMSDKGQGIRVFNSVGQLQAIFDSFEECNADSDEETDVSEENHGVIISQLRHFIVQEYQSSPLLLSEYLNKKFHLRVYVVSAGDLKVYVYQDILTLFSEALYSDPSGNQDEIIDLAGHLTNTCLQEDKEPLVERFWDVKGLDTANKTHIFDQVKDISRELFKAASSVDKINFQAIPNAVEFFGIDFLVNLDYSVKLLEVNSYPDFKQTGDRLANVVENLFKCTATGVVAPMLGAPAGGAPMLHQVL